MRTSTSMIYDLDEIQAHLKLKIRLTMMVVTTVKLVNFKTVTSKSFNLRLKNLCMMKTEVLSLSLDFYDISCQGIKIFKSRIGNFIF
jgi:hypothetical protein